MISVIIPVYNTENYVSRCIDSVLRSSCPDFEIILVNDGSTDASGRICGYYRKKDSRVRYIEQPHKGVSEARNRGIRESRGEWIVFVDSDDRISPAFLEMVSRREYRDQELLIFDFTRGKKRSAMKIQSASEKPKAAVRHYGMEDRVFLIERLLNIRQLSGNGNTSLLSVWAKAYKRDVIERYSLSFSTDIAVGEDRLFNIDYLLRMRSCTYTAKKVYALEPRPDSAMRGLLPDFLQNDMRYQKKLLDILTQNEIFSMVEPAYYNSVLCNMADVLVRGIFHPDSTRSRRENRGLCGEMQKNEIYGKALQHNGKTGRIPRRILLYLYRRKCYGFAEMMCKVSYIVLKQTRRL